jgi:hypothetical protein
MIELTNEQASVLKQGYPVRAFVPELDGEVVVLAARGESTESVLQETLDDIREQAARSELGGRAAKKARAKVSAPPTEAGSNGPAASARTGPPSKARTPRRSRKGTAVERSSTPADVRSVPVFRAGQPRSVGVTFAPDGICPRIDGSRRPR